MNIYIMLAVVIWAVVALIIAAFVILVTNRSWTRFSVISSTLFLVGWASAYAKYRSSATEVFRESSPNGKYHVVVYVLPSFGAFHEGTAIGRLFDHAGRQLDQGDIPFVGAADVTWCDKEVIVGDHIWELK